MRQHSSGSRVALGFRAHSGWAAMVALRDPVAAPLVVQRRRVELIDRGIPKQPFHAAEKMNLNEAEAFLAECTEVAEAMARKAVRAAVEELTAQGHDIAGGCILSASGRAPGALAATLASHTLIHTAEGIFFRDALRAACESCGLRLLPLKEKEAFDRAAAGLRIPRAALETRVAELGKAIGPPWTQDEKLSAIAAWLVLANH